MELNELGRQVHTTARDKGWWDDYDLIGELGVFGVPVETLQAFTDFFLSAKLALIGSEAHEALEAYRDRGLESWFSEGGEKPEGVLSELADTVIRCADFATAMGLDLDAAIEMKMDCNRGRAHKHGGKKI